MSPMPIKQDQPTVIQSAEEYSRTRFRRKPIPVF